MATGTEIIIATLLVLAIPLLLGVVWLVNQNRLRRRAALELKKGNKIFSEWQHKSANQTSERVRIE